ncbi:PREDICTED: uncharacterized protein LOC105557920 [Vollenhovia emeryi]|uniref:uncharacterized protein LOC105557920 n=1 Tax=Vollenhovia emeryi TaxID=411798 RepID=UPI0005F49A7A|nr:PREDICTED: uncharacterized protein LOC105557920 [Vollenhovia emeryi]
MAIRAIRGYRTVSHAAATLLAGMPPVEIMAAAYTRMYDRAADLKAGGAKITPRVRRLLSLQVKREAREEWRTWLEDPSRAGQRTLQAILPRLEEWLDRPWARASFRTTQVLTGHGCFGGYLHRIGRERTTQCHHCEEAEDSAQHTLEAVLPTSHLCTAVERVEGVEWG